MHDYKSAQDFAQTGNTFNTPQFQPTAQVSAPPPSFNDPLSQTPSGYQYAPNGIQPNPGTFQPNQPQLVAYPQQAQMPPQAMGLVQPQKVQQFASAAPLGVLGSGAAVVDCPRCNVRGVTRTSFVAGNTTHLWALGLCLCVLLPCIPYLMDSTKDVNHNCSNCGVQLATWYRSGNVQVHA